VSLGSKTRKEPVFSVGMETSGLSLLENTTSLAGSWDAVLSSCPDTMYLVSVFSCLDTVLRSLSDTTLHSLSSTSLASCLGTIFVLIAAGLCDRLAGSGGDVLAVLLIHILLLTSLLLLVDTNLTSELVLDFSDELPISPGNGLDLVGHLHILLLPLLPHGLPGDGLHAVEPLPMGHKLLGNSRS
jgi:hypothetical protein